MTESHDPPQLSVGQLALVGLAFAAVAIVMCLGRHTLRTIPIVSRPSVAAASLAASAALGWLLGTALLRCRLRSALIQALRPFRTLTSATGAILLVSALAGIGEELLFRSALQPWIGIWAASVVFGVVHSGTARLREGLSLGKATYLVGTVVAGLLLGFLYQAAGLLAAASAHAAFDATLLLTLAPALAAPGAVRDAA
jgi:membrane protease YdiL (CAAX protease family)